jgi:hypothetical protein
MSGQSTTSSHVAKCPPADTVITPQSKYPEGSVIDVRTATALDCGSCFAHPGVYCGGVGVGGGGE